MLVLRVYAPEYSIYSRTCTRSVSMPGLCSFCVSVLLDMRFADMLRTFYALHAKAEWICRQLMLGHALLSVSMHPVYACVACLCSWIDCILQTSLAVLFMRFMCAKAEWILVQACDTRSAASEIKAHAPCQGTRLEKSLDLIGYVSDSIAPIGSIGPWRYIHQ